MRAGRTRHRAIAAIGAATVFVAACGGDDAAVEPAAGDEPASEPEPTGPPASEPGTTDPTVPEPGTTEPSATEPAVFEPGDVEYRLVNLTDQPVDVYVRTQGLVQAFEAELGVAPGAVTEPVAPPERGTFLVTSAGAGDPECVASCDHVLVALTAFADNGPVHTVVLHDGYGRPEAFDLWESPPAGQTAANAMAPADPAVGRVVVTAIDVTDADFGLRLGFAGVPGCVEPVNLQGILVGGNQTPAFDVPGGSADVSLFDNQDRECAAEPVGGPFTVDAAPGARTHLLLTGSPGTLDAIALPFVDAAAPSVGG